MKRHSILLAFGAIVASSLSSGCYCYRPLLWRFGCASPYAPAHESGPLLGAPQASHAPGHAGHGVDPGCANCGGSGPIGHAGGAGYPIAQGMPMTGGYAGMPVTPGGYTTIPTTGAVAANPPFTGYPILVGSSGGQPALGSPVASKELPPPSVVPNGTK